MTRVRLSDPTLLDEFITFLARSGFVAEREDGDTLRLTLPLRPGPTRTQADIDVLLDVWLRIGMRIWGDLWPDSDVLVLADGDCPRELAAAPGALAS